MEYMLKYRGQSFGDISDGCPDEQRDQELDIPFTKKKGALGVWVEWFINMERGDNNSEADIGNIEVKTVSCNQLKSGKLSLKEVLRISQVGYDTIQTTSFEESGLFKKSKMLIILVSPNGKTGRDCKFLGFATIDLTPHIDQIKQDYESIQNVVRNGELLHTGQNKQHGRTYIQTYNSGSGTNIKIYQDMHGNTVTTKGKDMRIFKQKMLELMESSELNGDTALITQF